MAGNSAEVRSITEALAAPFEPREIKFKPQMVKNNKCLAIAYVDVRVIEDRMDEVLGPECWQDAYEVLPDGSVTCKLQIRLGGEWVSKMDVGTMSEQPDGGDRLKAAFSDALKRAAIKFGIGRYIYRLPAQWVDYDPAKKQIVRPPQLPAFAIPTPKADRGPAAKPAPKPQPAPPADQGGGVSLYDELADYLNAAGSMQELARVWESCGGAKKDGHISPDDYAELGAIKDRAKSRLGVPAGK